jgi:hypothetical protein
MLRILREEIRAKIHELDSIADFSVASAAIGFRYARVERAWQVASLNFEHLPACRSDRSEESPAANTQSRRARGFFAALRMTGKEIGNRQS